MEVSIYLVLGSWAFSLLKLEWNTRRNMIAAKHQIIHMSYIYGLLEAIMIEMK